jgi:tetratricopeptide (TPR) repeat protein
LCVAIFIVLACTGIRTAGQSQSADRWQAALTQFAVLLGGSYGDEGPQISGALDVLTRILPEWDRDVAALESRARTATDAQAHVDLARVYLLRGRPTEATKELESAARIDPARGDIPTLLGLMHWKAGRTADAVTAFRLAWGRDRANPVAAYWLLQSAYTVPETEEGAELVRTLTAAYQRALTLKARGPTPFSTAIPSAPDIGDAPLLLPAAYANGYARLREGDPNAALAQFRQAARTDPLLSDPAVGTPAMAAGSAALRQGRVAAAREQFRMAAAQVPASSEAHRLLALAALFDFEPERSIEELEAAIRIRPDDERSRVLLARLQHQQGDPAKAEGVLRATIAALPDSSLGRLWLGSTLVALNRDDEGAASLATVAAQPPLTGEARLLSTIATLQQNTGHVSEAIDAFMRSIVLNPNDLEAHLRRARALADSRQDQAYAEYVAVLLIDPTEPNAYMGIGQLHLNAGRYAEAVTALERLVKLQPTYNEAHYALGTALLRSGRAEDGNRELAEFARVQAKAAEQRRRSLAVDVLKQEAAVHTSQGAFDRAEAVWKQILELEPNVGAHHAALGAVLVKANRLDAAAASYERAAMLGAGPDVYRQLASIYGRLGRQAESTAAREKYERALLVPSASGAAR